MDKNDKNEPTSEADELEEAIKKLSPEEAGMFMRALRLTMHKRRLMMMGNLLALLLMICGMIAAAVLYAQREPGTFMGWVFLMPFAAGGCSLWYFGGRARRLGADKNDQDQDQTMDETDTGSVESTS